MTGPERAAQGRRAKGMKPINRAPFMFGAAVILPLIIFFGVQLAFSARDQRQSVRSAGSR